MPNNTPEITKEGIIREFNKKYSAEKIWVTPSADNYETIGEIIDFYESQIEMLLKEIVGQESKTDITKMTEAEGDIVTIHESGQNTFRQKLIEKLKHKGFNI